MDARFAIVSRWNGDITEGLLRGALRAPSAPGRSVRLDRCRGCRVPSTAAGGAVMKAPLDAVITFASFGAILPHFDRLQRCARAWAKRPGDRIPAAFGVLTTDTWSRPDAARDEENKGEEAALSGYGNGACCNSCGVDRWLHRFAAQTQPQLKLVRPYHGKLAGADLNRIEGSFTPITTCPGRMPIFQRTAPRWSSRRDRCRVRALDRKLSELDPVSLAILRLSTYELLTASTFPKVVINEGVNLTNFGPEAHKYVNGVLDR